MDQMMHVSEVCDGRIYVHRAQVQESLILATVPEYLQVFDYCSFPCIDYMLAW
jgi:hypothetical protein